VSDIDDLEIGNSKNGNKKNNQKFVAQINAEWGTDRKQELNVRINGEKFTPKAWIQKINGVDRYDFQSLAENMKLKVAFLNKFDISVDYKIQPSCQSNINRLFSALKAWNFWSTQIKPINGRDGSIFATVVIDPLTHEHLNVTVKTPSEKVLIDSIRMPMKIKPFELVRQSDYSSSKSRANSFMDVVRSYGSKSRPECKVDGRRVSTFDEVTYKAPLTKCYSVLAKDCSSQGQPRFAVLMKKLEGDDKKVKLIAGKQIIEVQPDKNGKLIVKINGDRMKEEELADYGIDYSENEVNIETRDVSARFNGKKIWIQLAQTHKNTQCGLCGHYNDDAEDEFRMANNEHARELKDFHKSYTVVDDECRSDMEETHKKENYRRMDSDEYNSSEEQEEKKNKKPIEKTQVVEYNHKVCFSEQPVKECPRRMEPKETESKRIKYTCLPRDSSEARQLLREARRNPKAKLDLPQSQNPSYTEVQEIPVSCSAY
jgi:hypothetical protein